MRHFGLLSLFIMGTIFPGILRGQGAQGTQTPPNRPTVVKRTAEEAKYKVCGDWDKDEPADTFCGFLRDNYSTLQRVCGLAPTKNWVEPWTWFRKLDPIKAVPPQILSSIHSRVLNTLRDQQGTDQQPPEYLLLEDNTSLSRLLTYVHTETKQDPLLDSATNSISKDVIATIVGPDAIGNNLQFDPILDPEIMLRDGNGKVSHTLSCSDVWSAMVNAGISFNPIKAAAKISAEEDTNTTYEVVYGLFQSPMSYMAEEHPETFYFEALDWYLRAAANSSDSTIPSANLNYVKAVRGIAIYSTLNGRTTTTGSGSASGGFTSPFFSIDASVSDNATSKGILKTQVFHVLLGEASSAKFPTKEDTSDYLNNSIQANTKTAPIFDKDKNKLKMSVVIEGMPHTLCQDGIWQVTAAPDTSKPGATGQSGGSSQDGDPMPSLSHVVYHKPGETVTSSSVRTRSQCEFELEGDANAKGNFGGALSPRMWGKVASSATSMSGASGTSSASAQTATEIKIPFSVVYDPPKPTLQAVNTPPASSKAEGDWDFQIVDSSTIDKGVDPETGSVKVNCGGSAVDGTTNATFLSLLNNARGSYLRIHATVPSSANVASISTCTLSGPVVMTARNGAKISAKTDSTTADTKKDAKQAPPPKQARK
jgi:hypothetical protein